MNWKDQEKIEVIIPKDDLESAFAREFHGEIRIVLESELYTSTTEKERPILRLYYEPYSKLDDYFKVLYDKGFNILNYFSTEINEQDNIYLFNESNIVNLIMSNGYWEQGRAYFEIILDRITKKTKKRYNENHAIINFDSNSSLIVDDVYEYEIFNFENKRKFEAISKNSSDYLRFGHFDVEVHVQFEYRVQSDNSFLVERFARLELNKSDANDYDNLEEIQLESSLVVSLLSLYYNYTIEPIYSTYNMSNHTIIDVANDGKKIKNAPKVGKLKPGFNTFLEFINTVNRDKIFNHENFTISIIKQYIFSTKLNDEARFMILYNVMEQFRNYYMKKFIPSVFENESEDYKTLGSKKLVKKHIKELIKSMVEVIDGDDKEEFLDNVHNKITFMTKKQMNKQLSLFFETINVNYDKIVLSNLLKLRNKVYHGSITLESRDPVRKAIVELESIIIEIFKDFLGVTSVTNDVAL